MATCLEIVTYAMRLSRIIGPGKSATTAEASEGMIALQSLYDQWRTGGMFGSLEDVFLDETDIAEEGKRYFVPTGVTLQDAESIYVDGEGEYRQPYDLALYETLTEAGAFTAKLYDRTEWVDLVGLVQGDTAPLSARGAYGLAACLAMNGAFQAIFGAEPDQRVANLSRDFIKSLMNKETTQAPRAGDYF